jgi:dolichol-phosphate mannosyltransferase
MKKTMIVIPAYNPGEELVPYVEELVQSGFKSILVIDDGSRESCMPIFNKIDLLNEVTLLRHAVNLGKGRALKNAINYLLNLPNEEEWAGIITADSDGQHSVTDVKKVSEQLVLNDGSLVLGTRNFDEKDVPFKSKFGNKLTKHLFKLLYGKKIEDTQTGLRGISRNILHHYIDLSGERFSYETDVLIQTVRKKVEIIEVPIETIYIEGNSETHFRPIADSMEIYGLLFKSFFKFMSTSIMSFLLDISLFQLFISLFSILSPEIRILGATVIARVFSALFNYSANKSYVFESEKSVSSSLWRYFCLAIIQLACSAGLVYLIYSITGVQETVIKVFVDIFLFFISYRIQKSYIF